MNDNIITERSPLEREDLVPPIELLFDGSKTKEDYKNLGEGYTRVALVQQAKLRPHERVLDLGSGNGQKARALAAYLNRQGSYVGLDINPRGIDWCKQAYLEFPNFQFLQADVYNEIYNPQGQMRDTDFRLPFPEADFDLTFLCSVFTHLLPDAVANYIREIARVLKPGGRCVASFFLHNAETMPLVEKGLTSVAPRFRISGYETEVFVSDAARPSLAVVMGEAWVRDQFAKSGLRLIDISFGDWRVERGSQDTLFLIKPVASRG